MSAQHVARRIKAPRSAVYRALLDPRAVAAWRVPDWMTSQVHAFEPREGGARLPLPVLPRKRRSDVRQQRDCF
jgi:uncharacterized protein YndB with AHSA1/START domain